MAMDSMDQPEDVGVAGMLWGRWCRQRHLVRERGTARKSSLRERYWVVEVGGRVRQVVFISLGFMVVCHEPNQWDGLDPYMFCPLTV